MLLETSPLLSATGPRNPQRSCIRVRVGLALSYRGLQSGGDGANRVRRASAGGAARSDTECVTQFLIQEKRGDHSASHCPPVVAFDGDDLRGAAAQITDAALADVGTVKAKVNAVDLAKREVTLTGALDPTVTLMVGGTW